MSQSIGTEVIKDILSGLLNIGPKNCVGVDIGLSAVRIAELSGSKSDPKLVNFAYHELPEGCLIEDEIIRPEEIAKAIKSCFLKNKIKNDNICIGISGPSTMAKRIEITMGDEEDIEDQVLWEAEQYVPFGLDNATLSYHVLGENAGGGLGVVVAAARNSLVNAYRDISERAGLKLRVVDLNIFALTNVYEAVAGHKNRGKGVLLIDFGAQNTNMVMLQDNQLVFHREINLGGLSVTEEIQRQMEMSYVEAESLKLEGDQNGNLPEEIVNIIEMSLETFFSEIKKSLNFFMKASQDTELDLCYIMGGASLLPGLQEGLEEKLEVEVHYLRPLEKIAYNKKNVNEDIVQYINHSGCISLGLALRNFRK